MFLFKKKKCFSLKFDCEKLAQEKIEVHRQYVMVNLVVFC